MKKESITVIVPALNEEGNIGGTLAETVPLLERTFADYEILLFDDGSTDKTGRIADDWAKKNPRIKVIHNPKTMGLGYNYRKGVESASKDYVMMIPGDNEITTASFQAMFDLLGKKEIVLPYTVNMEIRPRSRQLLSRLYTWIVNLLFGLRVKYYNGTVIHKRSIIQSCPMRTDSFSYQTEILVNLIKAGVTYEEVGMYLKERTSGESKALRLRNVYRVFSSILRLFLKMHLRGPDAPKQA